MKWLMLIAVCGAAQLAPAALPESSDLNPPQKVVGVRKLLKCADAPTLKGAVAQINESTLLDTLSTSSEIGNFTLEIKAPFTYRQPRIQKMKNGIRFCVTATHRDDFNRLNYDAKHNPKKVSSLVLCRKASSLEQAKLSLQAALEPGVVEEKVGSHVLSIGGTGREAYQYEISKVVGNESQSSHTACVTVSKQLSF